MTRIKHSHLELLRVTHLRKMCWIIITSCGQSRLPLFHYWKKDWTRFIKQKMAQQGWSCETHQGRSSWQWREQQLWNKRFDSSRTSRLSLRWRNSSFPLCWVRLRGTMPLIRLCVDSSDIKEVMEGHRRNELKEFRGERWARLERVLTIREHSL